MGRDDDGKAERGDPEGRESRREHRRDRRGHVRDRDRDEERKRPDPPGPAGDKAGIKEERPGVSDDRPGFVTTEKDGEVSMSIEETNRLRVALGLKPLKVEAQKSREEKKLEEFERGKARREAAEAREREEGLAERVAAAKERRRQQTKLSRTKGLGETDADGDDMLAWIHRSRGLEASRQEEQKREEQEKARRQAQMFDEQDEDGLEEEEGGGREGPYNEDDLSGMKVKHGVEELGFGETMMLTLEDKPILDSKGELADEEDAAAPMLENVGKMQEKRREQAFRRAGKRAKPLFEEDGRQRALLDKYDDSDEEQGMRVGLGGEVEAAEMQADIKHRLQQGEAQLKKSMVFEEKFKAASDYFTAEDMAAFKKPKKSKKKKRLRSKADNAGAGGGEGGEGGGLDLDALEAAAAAAGEGADANQRSRAERGHAAAVQERQEEEKRLLLQARFRNALDRANVKTQAMKTAVDEPPAEVVVGEEEEELYRSIERTRRRNQQRQEAGGDAGAAEKPAASELERLAEEMAERRQKDEEAAAAEASTVADEVMFTETTEFASFIHQRLKEERHRKPAAKELEAGEEAAAGDAPEPSGTGGDEEGMEVDDAHGDEAGAGTAEPTGAWTSADADVREQAAATKKRKYRSRAGTDDAAGGGSEGGGTDQPATADTVTSQQEVGRGLGSVLAQLRDTGDLRAKVEWAGRTNDLKKTSLQGLEDVYTGGATGDELARSIEAALTARDKYGRVQHPRERFREQAWRFHGKPPSKNKQEKKMRRMAEEISAKQAATSSNPSLLLDQAKKVQATSGTAFVHLQGRANESQMSGAVRQRDSASGVSTASGTFLTPMLGASDTPLTNPVRKVEQMYQLPSSGKTTKDKSMAPPTPKSSRRSS